MAAKNGENYELQDAATRIGILSQRTTNLETVVGDVRRELNQSILGLNQSIGAMSTRVDERFNSIASTIAERSRPQWQALSVMLAALVVMGGLLYWPVREQAEDMKGAISKIVDRMVTQEELVWRSDRGKEDRDRTFASIADLRSGSVTRNEWSERNASRDLQIINLQREIDELKRSTLATYNVRDVILALQSQVERLQQSLYESRSKPFS